VSETSQFLAIQQSGHLIKHPIPTMWANDRPAVLRGFALIASGSLAFNTFFVFMPNHLAATRKLDLVATLSITAATLAVTAAAAWALGRLSDAVIASASQLGLLIGQLIMGAVLAGVLLVAMVGELFPAPLRSTGMSITAGLATALVGGTAPVVDQILVTVSRSDVTPGLYVSLVACFALVALRRWPETAFRATV
jgi:MHS family proline/betaine transporter-like MFS transporter